MAADKGTGGSRRNWLRYAVPAVAVLVAAGYLWGPWGGSNGNSVRGAARVIDADTIEVGGKQIELVAIQTPQLGQRCGEPGADTDCGAIAARYLTGLVAEKDVTCTSFGPGIYKRMIAVCRVGGQDLGEAMVRGGQALAYRRLKKMVDYVPAEDEARRAGRGMWAGAQKPAWRWPEGAGKK